MRRARLSVPLPIPARLRRRRPRRWPGRGLALPLALAMGCAGLGPAPAAGPGPAPAAAPEARPGPRTATAPGPGSGTGRQRACRPTGPLPGPFPPAGPRPAFPGAEGAGAAARGGRGGDVYAVTSLADDGPGSLRRGIATAAGPRTIVFRVAGTIALESDLVIDRPFLTLAGQTAPGGGVTLRGRQTLVRDTHDVVVRHLRFRPGAEHVDGGRYAPDALGVVAARDVMVDHVSASWSVDEVLSTTHGSDRVTVQWSLVTEALHEAGHPKGDHGYGSLVAGGEFTFHHNLYAHNRSRNPRPGGDGTHLTFANNVVYNPGNRFGYAGSSAITLNYVANVGLAGPETAPGRRLFHGGGSGNRIYQAANLFDPTSGGVRALRPARWVDFRGRFTPARAPFPAAPVRIEPAARAFERVLARAGASRARDAVDERIVASLRAGTGRHIDAPDEVGGWPVLAPGTSAPDTDGDGMPDAWERSRCLDPADPADRNADPDRDGYTNLEAWLHERARPPSRAVPHAP